MELSGSLLKEFASVTAIPREKKEAYVYGTVQVGSEEGGEDEILVTLDGSDFATPVSSTIDVADNDRVLVMIKNHQAVITGNLTDHSVSNTHLDDVHEEISGEIADAIEDYSGDVDEAISGVRQSLAQTNGRLLTVEGDVATAVAAANGKNKIIHAASAPSGTDWIEGDTWFDTANGYKMHSWDPDANGGVGGWVEEKFDTDAFKARSVKTETLDAGAVTVGKITVGDTTNLATVNEFVADTTANPANAGTIQYYEETSGKYYVRKATETDGVLWFVVDNKGLGGFKTGDELYFSFIAKGAVSGNVIFGAYAYDKNNTILANTDTTVKYDNGATGIALTTSEKTFSGTLTLSGTAWSNAVFVRIGIIDNRSTKSQIFARQIKIRRKTDGDLIVEGAIKVGHLGSTIVDENGIKASLISAESISGKDITGGSLRTTQGNLQAILVNPTTNKIYGTVPADPAKNYIRTSYRGIQSLNPNNLNNIYSQILPAFFSAVREYTGYGWYIIPAIFSHHFYNDEGELISSEEAASFEILDKIGQTDTWQSGVSGVVAVLKRKIGVATIKFSNFSFPSGTQTDTESYQLVSDLWPVGKDLDLASTINGFRFKITESGYIQPLSATTSSQTIRGSFTYLVAGGDPEIVG